MITVVPVRLIRSSSSMMPSLVSGSRLPVGSSASSTSGRLTKARAIATRCCSPPESSLGSRLALPSRPTISSTSGTTRLMVRWGLLMTSSAKATFWATVRLRSRRKSWKTQPMVRRSLGTCHLLIVLSVLPLTTTVPLVGGVDPLAVDHDGALGRVVLLQQQPQEGRLARARGADEEDELALVDLR